MACVSSCRLICNARFIFQPVSLGRRNLQSATLFVTRLPRNAQPAVWSSTTWKQEFYDSYDGKVNEAETRTKVEVSKEDFKWVERLIPPLEIPKPPEHKSYPTPSGWSPPKDTIHVPPLNPCKRVAFPGFVGCSEEAWCLEAERGCGKLPTCYVPRPKEGTPYHVRRTKYHNLPVFIKQKHGGLQIWTIIKNVDGDIWAMAENLLKHLEEYKGEEVGMSVNEYTKTVVYKGLFEVPTKAWLTEEGF